VNYEDKADNSVIMHESPTPKGAAKPQEKGNK
jgi:hypothetical protein